jgi:hypothetical protein
MIDLNKEYYRDHFLQILRVFDSTFGYSIQKYDFSSKVFLSASRLGVFDELETEIIEVEVSSDVKNRLTITKEAFKLKRSSAYANAIVAFINPDSPIWRLSLLTTDYSIDEQGVKISNSNPKRFSYLLGPGTKVVTPTKNVLQKGTVKDLDDLKTRFSVEVVNKDFYSGIANSYSELIGGKRKIHNKNIDYKGILQTKNVEISNEEKQEFAVRLIGRILFMWFLKQKKSESNIPLIPEILLSSSSVRKNKDYYINILQPLFFEVLNTRQVDRDPNFKIDPYLSIPYLNGGLFNPQHNDYYNNKNKNNQSITIPDEWILSFFEMLEQYNFTIDENSSFDLELSIDPEMLGRIFENLLAEINPDTGETARKSTGSFYTPREIVDYMVSESMKSYLSNRTNITEKKLDLITSIDFGIDDNYLIDRGEIEQLFKAFSKLKVIDPACGSGAFPIGILQKINHISTIIDPEGTIWFEESFRSFTPEIMNSLNEKYSRSGFSYLRKLQIIRESIYGVDIQPVAVEISKLRCFLSLIVDEVIVDDEMNRGIEALPNLEFKFMAANSLIDLDTEMRDPAIKKLSLFEDENNEDDLRRLRNDYFLASYDKRALIRDEFFETQRKMTQKFQGDVNQSDSKRLKQLVQWNPFGEEVSDWLNIEWMFGIEGFDIVIQNPPYVSIKGIDRTIKPSLKRSYGFVDDLYNHFIHRGFDLLSKEGIQTVISPDTFFTLETKRALRLNILDRNFISLTFLGYNVFESAMVSTAITIVGVDKNKNNIIKITDASGSRKFNENVSYYIEPSIFLSTINNSFFVPNNGNLLIHNKLSNLWQSLSKRYGKYIISSASMKKNRFIIEEHIKNLESNHFTLFGMIADGGEGLTTGNNGKFVGVLEGTNYASRILTSRPKKLAKLNEDLGTNYLMPSDEFQIRYLFDKIKNEYGRDVFGQGYLYRIISKNEISDINELTLSERENGITGEKFYVPYDKGDKDGNRWHLENPYYISWDSESVNLLKGKYGKNGIGDAVFRNPQLYFREGLCYSNIKTHFIKARIKPKSIHDVTSKSFFSKTDLIPNHYLIVLLNSSIVADIINGFLNNTSIFQVNDARFLPIPVPNKEHLEYSQKLFNKAVSVQKDFFKGNLSKSKKEHLLDEIQIEVDRFVYDLYFNN